MATEQEILELLIKTTGIDLLSSLQEKLADVNKAAGDLNAAYGRGEVGEKEFAASAKILASEHKSLESTIRGVEAATKSMDAASRKAEDAAIDAAGAILKEQAAMLAAADAADRVSDAQVAAAIKDGDAVVRQIQATDHASTSTTRAAKSAREGAAQARAGLLDISRATQDFIQGGFGGILNNLEGIGRAIPALLKNPMAAIGSLPALLTLAGVAIFVFKDKIAEAFTAMLGSVKPFMTEVETLQKRIKELEKVEIKMAVETLELDEARKKLDQLKADQAAFNAAQKSQAYYEKQSGSAINDLLTEEPGGKAALADKLKAKMIRDLTGQSQSIREAQADQVKAQADLERATKDREDAVKYNDADSAIEAATRAAGARARVNNAQERARRARLGIEQEAEQKVGGMFRASTEGSGAEQAAAQQQLARQLAGIGRRGLARGISLASPKELQLQEQVDEGLERSIDQMKQDYEQRKESARKRKDLNKKIDDLNAQGHENELAGVQARQTEATRAASAKTKSEESSLATEAKVNESTIDNQVKKINATVGSRFQQQYEQQMAMNAATGNVPVAAMRRRLQQQMAAAMRRRGASEQSANLASRGIAAAGDQDIGHRMEQLGGIQGTNQQKLIGIAQSITGQMAHAIMVQEHQAQQLTRLQQSVSQLGRRAVPRQHTALNFSGRQ